MVFKEKKKRKYLVFLIALFVFSGVVFAFSDVQPAYALFGENRFNCAPFADGFMECWDSGGAKENSENPLVWAFKWLLYGIFIFFGWITSVAVTIFGWAINPDYISGSSGFFNRSSIYEMWKFIRDFFNLFFILILLYIAFTVVFQIQKNFKQALLSLILAALLVNFSFPISRFLIDVTNVPMYFFANQMLTDKNNPGESLGTVLKASQLQGILIPGAGAEGNFDTSKVTVSRLLAAIVFLFLFSITLLVLAVMFVIRLAALLILVIFSSVGFAASVIPGLQQYSKMWWDNFWKYAIFGPAAMLMLLVATRFFSSIAENDSTFKNFQTVAIGTTTSADLNFVASMAFFSIPIVMLWMTIGLAQKFSIVGAGMVSGKGEAFARWAGRKTYNNPVTRGIGGGLKEKTGINKFQKWMARPSSTEAALKGGVIGAGTAAGMRGGARKELTSIREREVQEKFEEHKKNKTNASILEEDMKSKDGVKRKAAALALADSKDITSPERLHLALAAVAGDMDQYAKVLQSADGKAMGMSADDMQKAVAERDENGAIKKDAAGNVMVNDNALKAVSSKMKKEGRIDVVVDYRVKKGGEKQADVLREVIDKMDAKEIPKQGDLLKHAVYGNDARIAVQNYQITDPDHYQQIKRNATGEINKLI